MKTLKYEVIHPFHDLQDKNKIYSIGDTFPKPASKRVAKKRIEELLSSENKLGRPLIKLVE
ncbi:hypothetical protein [uncultured Metabacillus sp.]|uniref:hypothetical protein n=1 Tax=uncultured Metabacillus sp. TaxID=2860135 RepID=UPI00261420FC|nr:hypothetical protein [uncultured Metabacillus sp.]